VDSSGVIFSGGLALHRLVLSAVIVFWSGWMSLARKPFSPCTSIGLKPVCVLMSIFRLSGFLAEAISIEHFSSLGGWMLRSSGV